MNLVFIQGEEYASRNEKRNLENDNDDQAPVQKP